MILFAWLLLATLGIFVLGLNSAWFTGQADPWAWGLPALVVLAVVGAMFRRSALWAGTGVAGTVLLFCGIAAARWPNVGAGLGLVSVTLLASVGGGLLRTGFAASINPPLAGEVSVRSDDGGVLPYREGDTPPSGYASHLPCKGRIIVAERWLWGGLALGLALVLLWFGPARPIATQATRPTLAVITALPLFWREGGAGLATPSDAPILTVLRTRFDLRPLDDPRMLAGSGARLLLLAQPRAMPPEALVALDTWVRGGGTALVLADPLLRWPSMLPIGDRRRAPSVHLLGPLLAHWGLEEAAPVEGEIRHFAPDGRLVTLSGAIVADPLLRRVTIGQGRVLLLGDADLIDDRLWLADPARATDPRAWSADTPALIADWLGAEMPFDRRWMREANDVRRAIRWALLFATGWALFGAIIMSRTRIDLFRNKT